MALADQLEHRAAEGLRAPDPRICGEGGESPSGQRDSRIRVNGPVRHEQGARTGVEECAREPGQGVRTLTGTGCVLVPRGGMPLGLRISGLAHSEKEICSAGFRCFPSRSFSPFVTLGRDGGRNHRGR